MKKVFSVILAITLLFSMCIPAFAVEEKSESNYNGLPVIIVRGIDFAGLTYSNGTNWACGYKFEILDGQLKLASQEDQSVVSIYESCTIPAEIKEEATATRSTDVVPFL